MKTVLLSTLLLAAAPAFAAATVGQPAPAFSATDTSGKPVSLADFKGKHVVLEWTNPGCPLEPVSNLFGDRIGVQSG